MKYGVTTMDEMDKILLTYLEKDARLSLKKLAQKMGLKTSTLYHRLHKLSESKTVLNFSVIVNPQKIGIQDFYLLTVELNLPNDPISRKLSENLAEKLSHDLKEVFFSAIGEDNTLRMVVSFFDTVHMDNFLSILSSNEYVKKIEKVKLNFIPKGLRMFDFNEDKLLELEKSKLKKNLKDSIGSEGERLGIKVNLDDNDPSSDLKREDEKEDSDGMIPL
jgi:DNA-binding Lrp family transcriptional regulator